MSIGASYQSLADFLARRDGDVWNATFDEVERVLRRPLPRSAYEHQAWWANQNGRGHSQTHGWRSVGWRTVKLDLERKRVCFEREKSENARRPRQNSFPDPNLFGEATRVTGIQDRNALIAEALRALIQRETSEYLLSLGGTMPDYSPAPRERPDA